MSVNSYLTDLASDLVLSTDEKDSITTSISTISDRLDSYFNSVTSHFKFGSSTRGTILPRKADDNSDIDYMVVFDTSTTTLKPQSYLDQLKKFVEYYYSTSEIHQSHPTIVLELKHIKFELVPAISQLWSGYQIPSPSSEWTEWMSTDPNGFNSKLTEANQDNNYKIKPLVRLIKYWNTLNGHHFQSFELEKYICNMSFWGCSALKDYFYNYWQNFTCSSSTPQYIKDKVERARKRVNTAKDYEDQGYSTLAETEIEEVLPGF